MKRLILPLLIGIVMVLCSCETEEHSPLGLEEGTYTGTFIRSSPTAKYSSSEVRLVFINNSFEGSSSVEKYPAICRGTYHVVGQEIEFKNECPWTAEFEWTYILNGRFRLSYEGTTMRMTKSYGEGMYDTYFLSKQ